MIPPTTEHPQPRNDVYDTVGVSPTHHVKETIAGLRGRDSLAGQVVPALDQLLTTPAFRQARWFRAFHQNVLTAVSILHPHASAAAQARMAQEYLDDLVHGDSLRTIQFLAAHGGRKQLFSTQEFAQSHGRPVQTNREETERFLAVCKALLIVLLRTCWKLAVWGLSHCLRVLWRILTWLGPILIGLLKRRCLIPKDSQFATRNRALTKGIPPRQWRQRRQRHWSTSVRRSQPR